MISGSLKILLETSKHYKADRKHLISFLLAGKLCFFKTLLLWWLLWL